MASRLWPLLIVFLTGCSASHQARARSSGDGAAPLDDSTVLDRTSDGWKKSAASKKTPSDGKSAGAKKPAAKATPAPKKAAPAKPAVKPAADEGFSGGTPGSDFRTRAVAEGRAILDGRKKALRKDCSGFVMTAYSRAGRPLDIPKKHQSSKSAAEMLYTWAKADGRTFSKELPKAGDLVFYRDTYGTISGRITHVAMVESVDKDGNVKVIHHLGDRYRRSPMNLSDPHEPLKNGYFRKRQKANDPVLSGELFVAYARPPQTTSPKS